MIIKLTEHEIRVILKEHLLSKIHYGGDAKVSDFWFEGFGPDPDSPREIFFVFDTEVNANTDERKSLMEKSNE